MTSKKRSSGRRVAGLVVAATLTFSALTACAPPGAEGGPEGGGAANLDTLKVGYIAPTTGNFAVAGKDMVDGWNLYWELNGDEVNGVTVETMVEDDAGNPEISLTKAHKLVEQDEVDVVLGPMLANTALAVSQYTSSVEMVNLQPVAASDDLTQRDANEYTIRTGSMGGSQSNYPGGEWAATEGGYQTAVTLCADYAFGWESCAGFAQGFTQNGGEIVKQIWFPNATTDFSTYVAQIDAADADLVYVATAGGAPGPDFLNAYLGMGLSIDKLLVNCCAADQASLRALGEQIIGLKSVSFWAEGRDVQVVEDFVAAYKESSDGLIPGVFVASGYVTASVVATVLEQNGKVTGSELVEAIKKVEYEDSIFGRVSWDDYNNLVAPVYIREVEKLDDGGIYNVPIYDYQDVDQWMGRDPEKAMQQPPYSQDFQGIE